MKRMIYVVILASILTLCSASWDQGDLEIFDLYEEVNGTFYEFLGVNPDAAVSEIRRSYRKLSLQLHPDKNKEENAEERFRQLVAVYEVLKDKEKREKYDEVLKNGLPDWRQPIYYYRKYRKMGALEISILVSLIFTVGHYLTWWVAYLEKKFEMDELLSPIRKRLQKKKAKGKAVEKEDIDTDTVLEKELGYRKPGRWDLLPFVLYRCFIRLVKYTINYTKDRYKEYKEKKELMAAEAEEEEEEEEVKVRPKRVKPQIQLRDASEFDDEANPFIPGNMKDDSSDSCSADNQEKASEWVDEDFAALAKSMAKFPGGTPGRWDRIAHELGRSSTEVIKKVKELKTSLTSNIATNTAPSNNVALNRKRDTTISEHIITKAIDIELNNTYIIADSSTYQSQEEIPDDYDEGVSPPEEPEFDYTVNKKSKVKTRPVEDKKEENENVEEEKIESSKNDSSKNDSSKNDSSKSVTEVDTWSQVQQKCLEAAIKQFPKSTSDRWTCIARAVPNKNKEQCIARFKILADHVKQRKTNVKNNT